MEVGKSKTVDSRAACRTLLGYLNFSSGKSDPRSYLAINTLFATTSSQETPVWRQVVSRLRDELQLLQREEAATFADISQASAVLDLVEAEVLPSYLEFHSDLLFHQEEGRLFGPFFVARTMEAVLAQGAPWTEARRIVNGALEQLNDYVGYRPTAVVQQRKSEPYPHERVGVIPVYLKGIGVSAGPYQELVRLALELIEATDPGLLEEASFSLDSLQELAVDPRAFDFDHPVNRRPNYQFGEWDPDHVDLRGRYYRFVVREVTLRALYQRIDCHQESPREELLFDAAAVLAGTILMGAGTSGWGPGAYGSEVTLGQVVQRIAHYRDVFYEQLLSRLEGARAERLRKEAQQLKQPFGGARQHLNAQLGRLRAAQREHAHVARLYARMGFFEAAREEAVCVPAPSARILCQLDCWLTAAHSAVDQGQVDDAATYLPLIRDLLERGIACGAIIDPWNILGLDARFPLFPRPEDSIHDERADELVSLIHRLLGLHSRIWSEAAARHATELCEAVADQFRETVDWWRQYAAHEVDAVEAVDPLEAYRAAEHVAQALDLWHKGGAATGDVAFWAPHAAMFDSPQAYALVVEALLERNDFVASMGLLMHWLSQAERVGLQRDEYSFFAWIEQWLLRLRDAALQGDTDAWPHVRRFFDYLEANAESYWRPPRFDRSSWSGERAVAHDPVEQDDDEEGWDEEAGLFEAAYENVVYRDTTDDGVDSSLYDYAPDGGFDQTVLLKEAERIEGRLAFINTIARLWKLVAVTPQLLAGPDEQTAETVLHWVQEAAANLGPLKDLIDDIYGLELRLDNLDPSSLLEYDQRNMLRNSLVEAVITVAIEASEAVQFLAAGAIAFTSIPPADVLAEVPLAADDQETIKLFASLLKRDPRAVRRRWPRLVESLESRPLLYVPINRGGNPHNIVQAKMRQRTIENLLAWMPRIGLLAETCQLIELARATERAHPVGPGAVTEFDEIFRNGYRALVESLVFSAEAWSEDGQINDDHFVSLLEQFTELLLRSWLAHSRTLRLSVLERLPQHYWNRLVWFIERYGGDLFTQEFLNIRNLRAILHQGVSGWLGQLRQSPEGEDIRLCREINVEIVDTDAVDFLETIFEAVVENYAEYCDYNQLTTQSDRGEMLYTLLDFIRLRTEYDRILWKLTPVILAHEILVRRGHEEVAATWRKATKQRTNRQARSLLRKLALLQQKHAMRMPSIMDRLGERFVRSLSVDRMRAAVRPAIEERGQGSASPAFQVIREEVGQFMERRSGAGWELPGWLVALEEEVLEVTREHARPQFDSVFRDSVPIQPLTRVSVRRQLTRAMQSA